VGLVDAGVDDVGIDVRHGASSVAGSRAAAVGVDPVDAPGEPLGDGGHRAVAFDVVHPLLGAHLVQALVGDAGCVALQSVPVGVEYLGTVPLGVLACGRGRVSHLFLLKHDYVPVWDDALRSSSPGCGGLLGRRHGSLLGQGGGGPGEYGSHHNGQQDNNFPHLYSLSSLNSGSRERLRLKLSSLLGDSVVVVVVLGNWTAGVRSANANKVITTSNTLHSIGCPTFSSTTDRGAASPHTGHATLGTLDYD
jgi:hypothetical protein